MHPHSEMLAFPLDSRITQQDREQQNDIKQRVHKKSSRGMQQFEQDFLYHQTVTIPGSKPQSNFITSFYQTRGRMRMILVAGLQYMFHIAHGELQLIIVFFVRLVVNHFLSECPEERVIHGSAGIQLLMVPELLDRL